MLSVPVLPHMQQQQQQHAGACTAEEAARCVRTVQDALVLQVR
jgi:hypothetical protein